MDTNRVVLHKTALTNVSSQKTLSEGSSVFVRVLKDNGNNSFTVAFSGKRINIKSELPLKPGTAFLAKIVVAGDKILLSKINNSAKNPDIINKDKSALLQKLGLPENNISQVMVSQMKMLGMKFQPELFEKARKISLKFKNRQEDAAQAAIILEDKGIPADENLVGSIIGQDEYDENQNDEKNDFVNSSLDYQKTDSVKKALSQFLESIFEGAGNNKQGILSLFNHSGFKLNKPGFHGSWIKIPFNFFSEKKSYSGFISLFVNPIKKVTEKIIVHLENEDSFSFFICIFENGKCVEIKSEEAFQIDLRKRFPDMKITGFDYQLVSEFYSDDENLLIVDGLV